ncbi:inositol monophosphatase family protein [Devosia sp. J2-20]|jgi:myo-inositol-1(or 4)-monophosphatase|uniref:Inositol-1-monophosphatase n=1 Tax=Devosia litorisediminis TaxID=2829817 RepID=A0A942I4F4_9HYPH|nr:MULTISPECIES: inositol monophosphatase family protein [Devosia]MBS3847221.1 inositol monophosphatase [Devosia litorisediminis]MCZ4346593.1 inositol monophosphatase family protein [Devosia neptuniae]WDQ99639.1 inositol monophosphatase family protein [Devosia sp. J2-20]|tara:strand:+ start:1722 stop:2516 length:795 start_codon:yes stop_codon:yes gene_type:complete
MARSAILNVMVSAAIKAGKSLTKDFNEVENLQVSRKGPADFVSKADLRAEQIIFGELQKARPTYAFLMEEGGEVAGTDGQHRWIIDPLDGTTNFLHSIPLFGVAIALERANEIVASVIYNPIMDELYTAEKGGGTWLNDRKRLRVAGRRSLSDAVVCTGIKTQGTANDALQLRQLGHINPAVAGIRRSGSIAMDMAWLAAGRYDALWEAGLAPWDVAPGMLMVKEAGGFVSDYAGTTGSVWNGQIVAGNEILQPLLLKELKPIQ